MNLDVNEVAAIIHRSYQDDGRDTAFMRGIQFALCIQDSWEWDRFEHEVNDELNRLHEASWGREYEKRPFYKEKMYIKHFDSSNTTCSYEIRHRWVETVCRTKDRESPYIFEVPASGWFECDTRMDELVNEQTKRFSVTVPYDDLRDWEDMDDLDEEYLCDGMIDWPTLLEGHLRHIVYGVR